MRGYKHYKLAHLNLEWIENLPKTINENGCWISTRRAEQDGYVSICIEGNRFYLHRLIMCIVKNLKYNDSWVARHGYKCNRACFNQEHLQIGTMKDNAIDSVIHGTNKETRKSVCPKCGSKYESRKVKSGWSKGKIVRTCRTCHRIHDLMRGPRKKI